MSRRLIVLCGLGIQLAGGVVIVLAAARSHGYLLPAQRSASRPWIEGLFRPLAWHQTPGTIGLALGAMAVGYLAVLRFGAALDGRWILAAIAAGTVLFLLAPPLLSTDVFNYIDYARLAVVHHLSPYTHVPSEAPGDAVYPFARWHHTQAVYGPVFILGSYPLGLVSPAVALWTLKALAALASLGCCALLWRLAGRAGRSGAVAAATFGLNPLLLVWAVGGAHNDVLMVLLLLAGVTALVEGSELPAGALVVAAAAVKATGALMLPFALAGASDRARLLRGALLAAALIGVVAFLAFPDHGVELFHVLGHERSMVSAESLPRRVAVLLGEPRIPPVVRWAFTLSAIAAIAALLVRAWRRRAWLGPLGWAFLVVVATSSWVLPWYAIWALPFAALVRGRLLGATLVLQGYLMVGSLVLAHR